MSDKLSTLFSEAKIEYFAPLSYSDTVKVRTHLIDKLPFIPQSVIVFLVPYYGGETENISRYAASVDYHYVIKALSDKVISGIRLEYTDASFAAFGDHSPIDERHAAAVCGLGILGDNKLLINEKYGTYVFIGEIFTDLSPEILGAVTPKPIGRCEGCGACHAACPTGALSGLSTCLSEITQRKGELSADNIEIMRKVNTVWGCDLCQTACPHNKDPEITPISYFLEDRIECLTEPLLSAMSDEEFSRRAFSWRGRAVLLRNIRELDKK